MSHVRPDTCAFEYTDAFRLAGSLPRNVVEFKRGQLARRIMRLEDFRRDVPEYLRAALRGYEDWLEFNAAHPVRSARVQV